MTYIVWVETIPFLVINSVHDIRKKQIYLLLTIFWGFCGAGILLGSQISTQRFSFYEWSGVLVAMAFLVVSKISKEAIGYGDGLIVLALSFYLSLRELVGVVFLSLVLSSIVATVLIFVFKKKKSFQMPFVPFLSLATIAVLIGETCL